MGINSLAVLSNILPGVISECAWTVPEDLPEEDWKRHGAFLGTLDRSVSWWVGDWWSFGEHKYGDRGAIVKDPNWRGPHYDTCRKVGWVSNKFKRSNLSFTHHEEVADKSPEEADDLLDWCSETIEQ